MDGHRDETCLFRDFKTVQLRPLVQIFLLPSVGQFPIEIIQEICKCKLNYPFYHTDPRTSSKPSGSLGLLL